MNIFFHHDNKNHSSFIQELAWSNHNERIKYIKNAIKNFNKDDCDYNKRVIRYYNRILKVCNRHKHEPAVTEEYLNKFIEKKRR